MLNSIKISNFRKHTDSSFEFSEGLAVIRGSNESGKSTVHEAIAYALFGVKALRTSLEDAVTYGEPLNSLMVVLCLGIDGVDYAVSRGKSGCECVYAGGTVTGQTEVSTFIASKLNVDANAAAKLMLAQQNEVRGALESGPKATTELIEKLSDFDQIDHLIDLMQEKLTLGSTATAQAQIDSAQASLERASVPEPDWDTLTANEVAARNKKDEAQKALDAAQDEADASRNEQAAVSAALGESQRIAKQIFDVQERITQADRRFKALADNPVKDVPDADQTVERLLAAKVAYLSYAQRLTAYREVEHLLEDGLKRDVMYVGDPQVEIDSIRSQAAKLVKEVSEAKVDIERLKGQLNSGNCTFCGKDFSDLPEIKAKNAELTKAIQERGIDVTRLNASIENHSQRETLLQGILKSAKPYEAAVRKYTDFLGVCDTYTPPILTWKGDVPNAIGVSDPRDHDDEIRKVRAAVKAYADYANEVKVNERARGDLDEQLETLRKAQAQVRQVGDMAQATQKVADAVEKMTTARQVLNVAHGVWYDAGSAIREARDKWEFVQRELVQATLERDAALQAMKDLNFNNTLLKKVRAARPLVADKLWALVLHAVGTYFSEMRGERSVVSKTSDGFMVDGHPVATLSGSTLDILGLAIRVALVRTFLPSSPFLLLDEPMSGCDDERTQAMLGFLAGVGFRQVLLVSHEDISETVADHIISLGE